MNAVLLIFTPPKTRFDRYVEKCCICIFCFFCLWVKDVLPVNASSIDVPVLQLSLHQHLELSVDVLQST